MAGKRQATSELNHDNWNQDEEPEERGTFKSATQDELKNRVIKKAKRNVVTGSTDSAAGCSSGTKSVFSSFSGFGKSAPTSVGAAFSFLAKIPSTTGTVSSTTATTSSTAAFSFGTTSVSSASSSTDSPKSTMAFGVSSTPVLSTAATTGSAIANFSFGAASCSTATKNDNSPNKNLDDYYAKVVGLNQAVCNWIKTHVDNKPLCILTPIFRDYEKYLKEFEEEKTKAETTEKKTIATGSSNAATDTFKFSEVNAKATTTTATPSTFSFSSSTSTSPSSTNPLPKTNGFSFGLKKPDEAKPVTEAPTTSAAANFSFGLKSSTPATSAPTTGFSFGKPASATQESSAAKTFSFASGSSGFSFANIKPPEASAATASTKDEDDDEPPKNEFKQVVEEDAVYSKKCKVFVKKDGNFVDKGVGTMYLKPIESNGKTQLIVRADTNLGNILVNFILSSGIPSQRMGKNNVMLVCVPTPEMDKPTPMLLRVKTGEEADDLLKNIEMYKK